MKNTPSAKSTWQYQQGLIADIRGLVLLHRELGIDGYPATNGLLRFLKSSQSATSRAVRTDNGQPLLTGSENCPSSGLAEKTVQPIATPTSCKPLVGGEELSCERPSPSLASLDLSRPPIGVSALANLENQVRSCRRCPRHQQRRQIVFGQGNPYPRLLLVGQAPWPEEEFSQSKAGVLLDRMLAAINLNRQQIYLTSLVKCVRSDQALTQDPLESEASTLDEIRECLPFLKQQIATLKPVLICTMGSLPAQTLLKSRQNLFRLRGKFHDFQGIPLMPTLAPDYLLNNQEMKKAAWQDLQMIQKKLQSLGQ